MKSKDSVELTPVLSVVEEVSEVELVKEEKPAETVHYIHGTQVSITDEQKAKFDELTKAVSDSVGDLPVTDIPLNHEYWARKSELDAFVAALKH